MARRQITVIGLTGDAKTPDFAGAPPTRRGAHGNASPNPNSRNRFERHRGGRPISITTLDRAKKLRGTATLQRTPAVPQAVRRAKPPSKKDAKLFPANYRSSHNRTREVWRGRCVTQDLELPYGVAGSRGDRCSFGSRGFVTTRRRRPIRHTTDRSIHDRRRLGCRTRRPEADYRSDHRTHANSG